jgi:transposase-like protein
MAPRKTPAQVKAQGKLRAGLRVPDAADIKAIAAAELLRRAALAGDPIAKAQAEYDNVRGQMRVELLGEDAVLAMIETGLSHREIARIAGCVPSAVTRWLRADEHRSARADSAMKDAAQAFDDLALEAIKFSPAEEIQRTRELAQHYRWKASKSNPQRYGDRTTLAGDKDHPLELRSKQEIATTLTRDELMAIAMRGRIEKSKVEVKS